MTGRDGQLHRARALLEQDRVWCAYALADLEPPWVGETAWLVGTAAVAILFRGLTPPFLFVHGDPSETNEVLQGLPQGRYQYSLLGAHRSQLRARLHSTRELPMWRMVLRPESFPWQHAAEAERLGPRDLGALLDLFGDHPDRPDSFIPSQLEAGVFFGVREDGRLVAAAGTHFIAERPSVAAIGSVFTHPDRRGHGFGGRASAAVARTLVERKLGTIVLNVAMDNGPALHLYRALGFWPFCGYYEGVGEITAA